MGINVDCGLTICRQVVAFRYGLESHEPQLAAYTY